MTLVTWVDITAYMTNPGEVLKKVPGLELVEMPESRIDSLCCGGGGGRIWMDTSKRGEVLRFPTKARYGVGADVLATSCPYCIANFEDSRSTSALRVI